MENGGKKRGGRRGGKAETRRKIRKKGKGEKRDEKGEMIIGKGSTRGGEGNMSQERGKRS